MKKAKYLIHLLGLTFIVHQIWASPQPSWQWAKRIGAGIVRPRHIALAENGNIWIVGRTGDGRGGYQMDGIPIPGYSIFRQYRFIAEYDKSGQLLRHTIFSSDQTTEIEGISIWNNSLLVSGWTQGDIVWGSETLVEPLVQGVTPFILKCNFPKFGNPELNLESVDVIANSRYVKLRNRVFLEDGSYFEGGEFFQQIDFGNDIMLSGNFFGDMYTVKYSPLMVAEDAVSFGGQCGDTFQSIGISSSGLLYASGLASQEKSITCWGVVPSQAFLALINMESPMSEMWMVRSRSNRTWGRYMDFDAFGHVYVGGACEGYVEWPGGIVAENRSKENFAGRSDIYVTKFDPNGNAIWAITTDGERFKQMEGMAIAPDGQGYVIGTFDHDAKFGPDTLLESRTAGFLAKFSEGSSAGVIRYLTGILSDRIKIETKIALDAGRNAANLIFSMTPTLKEDEEVVIEYSDGLLGTWKELGRMANSTPRFANKIFNDTGSGGFIRQRLINEKKTIVALVDPFLEFPLLGKDPWTVKITAIMDHHNTNGIKCIDEVVTAFTGEEGRRYSEIDDSELGQTIYEKNGKIVYVPGGDNCSGDQQVISYPADKDKESVFSINGQYAYTGEASKYLSYDGHSGYDYPVDVEVVTEVRAAATGKIGDINFSYNQIVVNHSNGFRTYYTHVIPKHGLTNGDEVTTKTVLGTVENDHLHFTVKWKAPDGVPHTVDPYGWMGEPGKDPLEIPGYNPNSVLWKKSN